MYWFSHYTDSTQLYALVQQAVLPNTIQFYSANITLRNKLERIQCIKNTLQQFPNKWIVFCDATVILRDIDKIISTLEYHMQKGDDCICFKDDDMSFVFVHSTDSMRESFESSSRVYFDDICLSYSPSYTDSLVNLANVFDIQSYLHLIPRPKFNIFRLHNPKHYLANVSYPSKTGKSAIVFELNMSAGIYSMFFFICEAYLLANKYNYDFYISDNTWPYKYERGWHDYFDSFEKLSDISKYDQIINASHLKLDDIMADTANTLAENAHRCEFTLNDYIMCIEKLYKPNESIVAKANDIIQEIGVPYISIFVRRGDKISSGESSNQSIDAIIAQIDISDSDVLFVQTDDYSVVEEIREILPNNKIYSTVPITKRGFYYDDLFKMTNDERKLLAEETLIGVYVCTKAHTCWTDDSSNVGRFIKLKSYHNTRLYKLKDDDDIEKDINLDAISVNPAFPSVFRKNNIHLNKVYNSTNNLVYLFKKVMEFFDAYCDIKPILFYGSLLGYYREGSFIEHDDDIDVILDRISFNKFQSNLFLNTDKIDNNYRIVIFKDNNIMQIFYNDIGPFDIYAYDEYDDSIIIPWDGYLKYNFNLILPLQVVTFNDTNINIPHNTEKILNMTYGPHWRIPLRKDEYNWIDINSVERLNPDSLKQYTSSLELITTKN